MNLSEIVTDVLCSPSDVQTHAMGRLLAHKYPDMYILRTEAYDFRPTRYADAGHCVMRPWREVHEEVDTDWETDLDRLKLSWLNGIADVEWRGHRLILLRITVDVGNCGDQRHFLFAESREIAEAFFLEVCRWCVGAKDVVMVFQGGYWYRSEALHRAIQSAKLDELILAPGIKERLVADFESFFESREVYAEHGIPWKRGILITGPPGNGKTHLVKALVNHLGKPALYVRSLNSRFRDEHKALADVFRRARASAPCILIFEDIDSMITDRNRSYFLNEMDGFQANDGVLTVATTNNPEKLDPAIRSRPSRFDRKYEFGQPEKGERRKYLATRNAQLKPNLRLTSEGLRKLAKVTDGFSYAYLKELMLSAMMDWMLKGGDESMDSIAMNQVGELRAAIKSSKPMVGSVKEAVDEDELD